MQGNLKKRDISRKRRTMRIRRKIKGTKDKPRMCISKTNKHLSVQLIDDENSKTIAATGTISKEFKNSKKCKESAAIIGKKIAELAKSNNVGEVVFDRGRYKYHGLLAELANAARSAGLKL